MTLEELDEIALAAQDVVDRDDNDAWNSVPVAKEQLALIKYILELRERLAKYERVD